MSNYKAGTFKWFSEQEITQMITGEICLVMDILNSQGVEIDKGGLWNVKAPDPVLYTNKPYEVSEELEKLAATNENVIVKKDGFIGFRAQRLSIVYE